MAISPMMSHYLKVKEDFQDCIIFYRLGDFYEMFFDDAIKASSLLDLTLTGRDCGLEERAPMCGVPYHAADLYISKLVALGEKVAICEQVTQATGKELVKREITKIVTAGTITNDENIDDKSNNFICAVYTDKNNASYAWADITTGEFFTAKVESESGKLLTELTDRLIKIDPVQIICNHDAAMLFSQSPVVVQGLLPRFERYTESEFDCENAFGVVCNQLKVLSLSHIGLKNDDVRVIPAGVLISYMKETQKHALANINELKVENVNDVMMLDVNSIRNLELSKTIRDGKKYGSLLWLLDKTKTSMGARKLHSWILSPLNSIEQINKRLEGVKCFYDNTLIRQSLTDLLSDFRDISRISGKISNNKLLPGDCISLCKSLNVLPNIKFQLSGISCSMLTDINDSISDFSSLCALLERAISKKESALDGEYIKAGYNAELDELRDLSINGKNKINEIEAREREVTSIRNLRISYNRVFGYYIEVTNSFKDKVPYHYVRKQTLANAERYITEELKELEVKILSSEEKTLSLELKLFNEIKEILKGEISAIKKTSDAIAELDVLLSFATVARANGYVMPTLLASNRRLNIVDGRHPVVEATSKVKFVPNDTALDQDENRMMIITGPNMAGKSTYMRQVAIITLLAHIGSFVPAKSAEIPITDRIFTRIGASDSLISDQSTFMVEMSETALILKNATENSLIILDEIGRGTSTFDGLSIAWAVVEYITKNIKAKTLFATHYHELTELEGSLDGVKNYKVTVKEFQNSIIFLRKIMRGGANRSFGIEVAELAGVEKDVTQRAKEILKTLENNDMIKSGKVTNTSNYEKPKESEIERIIRDIDVNNLSPMQAFNVLLDLNEKLLGK